jgi:hypothetical protein
MEQQERDDLTIYPALKFGSEPYEHGDSDSPPINNVTFVSCQFPPGSKPPEHFMKIGDEIKWGKDGHQPERRSRNARRLLCARKEEAMINCTSCGAYGATAHRIGCPESAALRITDEKTYLTFFPNARIIRNRVMTHEQWQEIQDDHKRNPYRGLVVTGCTILAPNCPDAELSHC